MYCINCGVKLSDTEKRCPLCDTLVYHPEIERESVSPLYPKKNPPEAKSKRAILGGATTIIFLIPLIVSFFSDFLHDGSVDWFGFVAGGLIVGYIAFALPLWFKKPNPVIFVPCSFASAIVFLLYINLATCGNWFLSFAFPVAGALCIIVSTLITLLKYVRGGRLYIFAGTFISTGLLLFMTEMLLSLTFSLAFVGWSLYPLAVLCVLGLLLIYLAINRVAREFFERKLFF